MGGRASRNKGHNFERSVAKDFRGIFGEGKRGFQTRGGTAEEPDVITPHFSIECKAHKVAPIRSALRQATVSAETDGKVPLAILKDDRKRPFITMYYDDFLDLVKQWHRLAEPKESPS
jgi:hypothetical protein